MSQDLLQDPQVRKVYDQYNKDERRRLFKIVFWFAFFGMPAGISLDQQVYPAFVPYFLKLRLLSSVLVTLVLAVYYRPWAARFDRALFILLLMVPQGIIAWMVYATEGPFSPYYAGLNLVLVAFCLLLPWTYQETLVFAVVSLGLYVTACLLHGGVTFGGVFFNNTYFMMMTATFAVIGSYFTNRLRVREFVTRYELDENRKKLIELDRMKSQFFANISHELRTPLTLLIAPLEELGRSKSLDPAAQDTLRLMQANAMRLLKLINDLLDLAKLESGRMEVRKEPLVLADFLKGLTLSVQGAAKDKRVQLETRLAPDLGTVLLDGNKLEKVVLNLLFNSVKFTPAGGKVELSAQKDGDSLKVQVSDTGMGIAEKDLPFIFDRFWQADATAQRKYQGTGIGLSLVKELAEAQGGSVKASSRPGEGTVMTVRLPYEKAPEGTVPAPATLEGADMDGPSAEWLSKLYRRAELFPSMTPLSATLKADEYGKSKRPRVLIADDEPDMLRFLRAQMEKDYEVLEAVDGNQAIEKARQFLPNLLLLDMMMPEKDGITVCRELKRSVGTQAIPILLLTARADEATKFSALEAGANDFLTKPFSTTELAARTKNLIESQQFQRELAIQKNALESTLEQLKETEGQLVQNEKMASLGRLSAGIIHEINNPLNYANSALHVLKSKKDQLPKEDQEKYGETVADIEDGIGRVQRIVSDLRTFTHPKGADALAAVGLEDVVSTALRFLSHELKDRVQVEVRIPEGQKVMTDRNKLVHVFVNLFQNSADALKDRPGARLSVEAAAKDGKVRVKVRDNGTGIDPKDMDKIFDPFFTTKDVGQGMGLGLSLCYRILQEQGGDIRVKSEKGSYTEFELEIGAAK